MNEVVKRDILSVLERGAGFAAKKDSFGISELSNQTIHNASIFQDEDSLMVAVVMYALSKVIQRGEVKGDAVAKMLRSVENCLRNNDIGGYRKNLKAIVDKISSIDSKMKLYVTNVIEQAQVKKGYKLCAHGISVARAAKLLGISQWELLDYVGKTGVFEEPSKKVHIKQRIMLARRLFS